MLETNPDYLAQIQPPAIRIEVFPINEIDGTWFSTFHCKGILPEGEAVGHYTQNLPSVQGGTWPDRRYCVL